MKISVINRIRTATRGVIAGVMMFGLVGFGLTTVAQATPINLNISSITHTTNTFQGVLALANGRYASAAATAANAIVSVNDYALASSRMSVGVITTNTLQGALSAANGRYAKSAATVANAVVGITSKSAGASITTNISTLNTGQLGLSFANGLNASATATAVNAVTSITIN